MKQVFIIVLITASVCLAAGCGQQPANTEVVADGNSPEPASPALTDAKAALAEGDRLFDENQTDAAIQAYKKALELDPDYAEAHFKLAVAYALLEMQAQQNGEVIQGTNDGKVFKPNSELEYEKAIEAYRKHLKKNPTDDAAHYNLGRALTKLLKDEDAEEAFREAVKLKPEETEYQTELGDVLIKLAKYREAIPFLKKAIELDPDNTRASELLEDAEAGRQRIDYKDPRANNNSAPKGGSRANSNGNSAANSNTSVRPTNTNSKAPPPTPSRTLPNGKRSGDDY